MAHPPFIIRPPKFEDIAPYTDFLSDPNVSVWLDDSAQVPLSAARVEAILLREAWCLWSIDCEGSFVGVTSLYTPDLARGTARYSIVIGDPKYWGRGLGTAIVEKVIDHGFTSLGLRKIESDVLEPNKGALIIHRRAGFVEEGRLRQDAWRRGQWVDRVLLSIVKGEWLERNPSA